VRRVIRPGPNSGTVNRLVGAGALIAFGNRDGSIWTDLNHEIIAPPIDASHSGTATYRTERGEQRTGGLSLVDGTPWAVWIELGEGLVLAPARVAVARMTWLALACIGIAIVAGTLISRHIVRPLDDLTRASEAIAAGALDARVKVERRDEIGRLATSFNAMNDQIAAAHRELEARVQHRTAKLEEAHALLGQQVHELERTRGELEHRAGELAALNRELEAFSYSVSHDLRAPLRHIHGFVGLMEHSAGSRLTDEEKRWLGTIASASGRMGRLIDDLLAFSKMSRASLVPHPLDLNRLIADVKKELTADGSSENVEWHIGTLPTVEADEALLRQVFINLISNALKYSKGRPRPIIEIGATDDDHGQAVVFVRDNGVGFDMKYAKKLFGVFQRLHNDEQFEGTGIGLANVQRIVHRHGGRVWANAQLDQGATFFVALPRSAANPAPEGPRPNRSDADLV
jgi:signal transduction histidine kinase